MNSSTDIARNMIFGGYENDITNCAYPYSVINSNIYGGIGNNIINGPDNTGIDNINALNLFGMYNYGIKSGQFVIGKYNKFINEAYSSKDGFIIGGGTSNSNRLNRYIINNDGDSVLRNDDNKFIAYNPISVWKGYENNTTLGTSWDNIISGANKVAANYEKWDAAFGNVSAIYNLLYINDKISERKIFTLNDSLNIIAKDFDGETRYAITDDSIIRLDKNSGFSGLNYGLNEAASAINYVKNTCQMTVAFDEYNSFINNVQINFHSNILPIDYMQFWQTSVGDYNFPILQIPMFQVNGKYYDKIKNQSWYNNIVHYTSFISGNDHANILIDANTNFNAINNDEMGIYLTLNENLIDIVEIETISGLNITKLGWMMHFNLNLG